MMERSRKHPPHTEIIENNSENFATARPRATLTLLPLTSLLISLRDAYFRVARLRSVSFVYRSLVSSISLA